MTTIVYRKWIGLLGDKRWVWSDPGYIDTCKKLFSYKKQNYDIYLWTAGAVMISDTIIHLFDKYFNEWFSVMKLYDLQKDFSIIDFDKTYDYIFIYHQKLDKEWKPFIYTRVFHINNNLVEESHHTYATTWSWSPLVDWILLANPTISNEELFNLISSHDIYTSAEFDFIPIK